MEIGGRLNTTHHPTTTSLTSSAAPPPTHHHHLRLTVGGMEQSLRIHTINLILRKHPGMAGWLAWWLAGWLLRDTIYHTPAQYNALYCTTIQYDTIQNNSTHCATTMHTHHAHTPHRHAHTHHAHTSCTQTKYTQMRIPCTCECTPPTHAAHPQALQRNVKPPKSFEARERA